MRGPAYRAGAGTGGRIGETVGDLLQGPGPPAGGPQSGSCSKVRAMIIAVVEDDMVVDAATETATIGVEVEVC